MLAVTITVGLFYLETSILCNKSLFFESMVYICGKDLYFNFNYHV